VVQTYNNPMELGPDYMWVWEVKISAVQLVQQQLPCIPDTHYHEAQEPNPLDSKPLRLLKIIGCSCDFNISDVLLPYEPLP